MDDLVEKIRAVHAQAVADVVNFRREVTLIVPQERLLSVCQAIRAEGFDLLEDIVADDMFPDYPRFAVSYHLFSVAKAQRVRVRVPVEDPDNGPPTLDSVWPIANWLELEVYDLMGITFQGNNALRRLFLPEDWVGFPLRKDYPVGYEEIQFSFNWRDVEAQKPYGGQRKRER
jgi:NADH-quinone oxidoreductase subunit C